MRARCLLRLVVGCFCAAALPGAVLGQAAQAEAGAAITPAEKASLRPVVEIDLKKLLASMDNSSTPSQTGLDAEFAKCTFSRIDLGALGSAVLVDETDFSGATNQAMLDVYIRAGRSWRRIAEGEGFGPRVVANAGSVPDLVFGWTGGVCSASYTLLRYQRGEYVAAGCDREVSDPQGNGDDCSIAACESPAKLPTFPDPWPAAADRNPAPATIANGPGPCTPNPVLDPATATVAPGGSVTLEIAMRFAGTCPSPGQGTDGAWTTSDPANTSVTGGVVTCLHPTPSPAIVRYTGSWMGKPFLPAAVTCQ
ncbi:MAG TPA: hypothetical protein VIY53_20065 [Acidobacteriaceae bacterium]